MCAGNCGRGRRMRPRPLGVVDYRYGTRAVVLSPLAEIVNVPSVELLYAYELQPAGAEGIAAMNGPAV